MKLEKRFKDGALLMAHGWNIENPRTNNIVELIVNGAVICFWVVRMCDDEQIAEIQVVHSRLTNSTDSNIMDKLKEGQRMADALLVLNEYKIN